MRDQKILFTLGPWTIRKWNQFRGSFVNCEACDNPMEGTVLRTQTCGVCDTRIPDEVVGLWMMLNADKIPMLVRGETDMTWE